MRSIICLIVLLASFQALAQSFVLQNTGRLLTIDRQGFIYDLNHSVAPDQVSRQGKNWLLTKNEGIVTVSADGMVFRKPEVVMPKKIVASNGIWLVGDKAELVIVSTDGMVYSYQEELLRKSEVVSLGGNWLVAKNKAKELTLITIDIHSGRYYAASQAQLASGNVRMNIANIRRAGNHWFLDMNGRLFVVGANGGIENKSSLGNFYGIRMNGGNFFVTAQNETYVVLDNGMILLPYLPMNLGSYVKLGSTYAWDASGKFYTFAEAPAQADRQAANDPKIMDRLLRSLMKLTVEQPALDSTL